MLSAPNNTANNGRKTVCALSALISFLSCLFEPSWLSSPRGHVARDALIFALSVSTFWLLVSDGIAHITGLPVRSVFECQYGTCVTSAVASSAARSAFECQYGTRSDVCVCVGSAARFRVPYAREWCLWLRGHRGTISFASASMTRGGMPAAACAAQHLQLSSASTAREGVHGCVGSVGPVSFFSRASMARE
jgi:hypothetical protein